MPRRDRNPTNLRNVEKVWIAEQKAAAEDKKMAELKKQIAEERQLQVRPCLVCLPAWKGAADLLLALRNSVAPSHTLTPEWQYTPTQELKELQVKAGLADKGQLEKLDWMYEGPMATMQDHQNNTEQYLLGKEVELKAQDSEVKKVSARGEPTHDETPTSVLTTCLSTHHEMQTAHRWRASRGCSSSTRSRPRMTSSRGSTRTRSCSSSRTSSRSVRACCFWFDVVVTCKCTERRMSTD